MGGVDYSFIETKAGYKVMGKTDFDVLLAGGGTKSQGTFVRTSTGTSNQIFLGWSGTHLTAIVDVSYIGKIWTENDFDPIDFQANLPYSGDWSGHSAITGRKVIGEFAWRNYGNGHTIFDISSGVTPSGVVKSRTDSEIHWEPTFPTLVGYNGNYTYGVRVDSARVADSIGGYTPSSFIQSGDSFTRALGFSGGNINGLPYIYTSSGEFRYLALDSSFQNYYTKNEALNLFVGKNGVETIYDTKTFDSSPVIPPATLPSHAARLDQVTDQVFDYVYDATSPTSFTLNSKGKFHNLTLKGSNSSGLNASTLRQGQTLTIRNTISGNYGIKINGGSSFTITGYSIVIFYMNEDNDIIVTEIQSTTGIYN